MGTEEARQDCLYVGSGCREMAGRSRGEALSSFRRIHHRMVSAAPDREALNRDRQEDNREASRAETVRSLKVHCEPSHGIVASHIKEGSRRLGMAGSNPRRTDVLNRNIRAAVDHAFSVREAGEEATAIPGAAGKVCSGDGFAENGSDHAHLGSGEHAKEASVDLCHSEQIEKADISSVEPGRNGRSAYRKGAAQRVCVQLRRWAYPVSEWLRVETVAAGGEGCEVRAVSVSRSATHLGFMAHAERHPRICAQGAGGLVIRRNGSQIRTPRLVSFIQMGAQFRAQQKTERVSYCFWCRCADSNHGPTHYETDTRLYAPLILTFSLALRQPESVPTGLLRAHFGAQS